jgi:hypothetical protein
MVQPSLSPRKTQVTCRVADNRQPTFEMASINQLCSQLHNAIRIQDLLVGANAKRLSCRKDRMSNCLNVPVLNGYLLSMQERSVPIKRSQRASTIEFLQAKVRHGCRLPHLWRSIQYFDASLQQHHLHPQTQNYQIKGSEASCELT